jgi:hypothetical protein
LRETIDNYFVLCDVVTQLKRLVNTSQVLDIRYEEFVKNPSLGLKRVCHFLELEAQNDYLADCASIVYSSPRPSRHNIEWDSDHIDLVKAKIGKYPFLEAYSYEE